MAQPAGYSNDTPRTPGLEDRLDNSRLVVNGQPPQLGKPPMFTPSKTARGSLIGQQMTNSTGPAASNGPPMMHNYSTPGSLSSHSSRNASPTPPGRHGGVSQSMENLSLSNPVSNNHSSQHGNAMDMPLTAQQQSSNDVLARRTLSPLSPMGGSQTLSQTGSVGMNSQTPSSYQGTVGNQYLHGNKSSAAILTNSTEPSKPGSFPINSHNLHENIPSQGSGISQHDHRGVLPTVDSRNSASTDKTSLNSVQHSPLSLSSNMSQTSQVHTQPLASSQTSVNGPASSYMPHKSMYPSPQPGVLPPVSRTNTQGTLPLTPVSQQGHFTNLRTSVLPPNTPANTKPSLPPGSQFGQNSGVLLNSGSGNPSLKNPAVPFSGANPGVMKAPIPSMSQPHQFRGSPAGNAWGVGQPPVSQAMQYPGMPPGSSSPSGSVQQASFVGSGSTPGNSLAQYPGMSPASHSGQSLPAQYPPSASGHPSSTNNIPAHPGMPPTSIGGFNQIPGNQQVHYPGLPTSSASGLKQPPISQQAIGPSQHSRSQLSQYPSMPPSSLGQTPPNSQPARYPGMPPPPVATTSGPSQLPPSSHSSQIPGTSQPSVPSSSQSATSVMAPVSQYPGMPPMPGQGYSQSGMPPVSSSGYQSGDAYSSSRRYPQQPGYMMQSQPSVDGLSAQMSNLSVAQAGFNKLWGLEYYDLLQTRNILPPEKVDPPKVTLHQEFLDNVNCSPEIFRCTLTKIPESNSLLQKARLPLGILIHPFKDLNHLPVIQCSSIVRCRACRTYINPFIYFVDQKRWKCNLCFRVNELPEEFQYDPVTKTYGDPTRRPEIKSSTIEFIAPSEYMLRPPQPAVYLFVLDVSQLGVESGYLQLVCNILMDELERLPGDGRTQIGFITFDSSVHFYNLAEGLSQPQQMVVVDTDDIFLPCPDNLLVNLSENKELIKDLLTQLPIKFRTSHDIYSALGPALQAAYKLMSPTGGRVTVFQSCLPTKGPGALTPREDPSQRAGKEAPHLNPAIDFYKRLALDCSGQQVAVDLFVVNSQYCDLATISGVSRFSGGCIHHFPLFKSSNSLQAENFERVFRRYLERKIGFEAVMRIRCSRGLAIHTFHGNFFVRSTDLLSLPNVNPDAGFGMQVSIEESLSELQNVCFQAALLYTTSKGERRIRVHTLCLPVATTLPDILHSADQQCIIGLLAKMAVDRSLQTSLSDAREAFINVAIDVLSAYRLVQSSGAATGLLAPHNLRLLPLYILALLKYVAFRSGQSTRLDDRVFAMCQMKTLPLINLIQMIYPDMYPLHNLEEQMVALEDGSSLPQPPHLHLSAEKLDQRGVFLLDTGEHMMIYVGRSVSPEYCTEVLGVPSFSQIPEEMYELPVLETQRSENLRNFLNYLQSERPYCATLQIIKDDGHHRTKFTERLIEDRTESTFSYYEFLQHLKTNVK
ncbi:protein transport protein Sec24A [Anabrus simplex]|uniref:protein transport protein Sec24A n=1 Tax=Anabrus simplex TaxID=316456 RepID=UPI0035A33775